MSDQVNRLNSLLDALDACSESIERRKDFPTVRYFQSLKLKSRLMYLLRSVKVLLPTSCGCKVQAH
uniref:Uncharacterized protein n=1 Tax=Mesocestoides corti TaxID=53468 RepID=A0A5K3EU72_MESCO